MLPRVEGCLARRILAANESRDPLEEREGLRAELLRLGVFLRIFLSA